MISYKPYYLTIKINSLKKLPALWAAHAFLVILCLLAIGLVAATIVLYFYILLPQKNLPQPTSKPAGFDYDAYKKVTGQWQAKEMLFGQFNRQPTANPFFPQTFIPVET